METLYNRLIDFEQADEDIKSLIGSSQIDMLNLQKRIFSEYEKNPILYDAIKDRKSIERTVEEITQINGGIGRILPWKKDIEHNGRLNNLRELIDVPDCLRTQGFFVPDNFITATLEISSISFGILYPITLFVTNSEEIRHIMQISSAMISSVVGFSAGAIMTYRRTLGVPEIFEEAKYLDKKIKKLYK